jgi:hypothetical protein
MANQLFNQLSIVVTGAVLGVAVSSPVQAATLQLSGVLDGSDWVYWETVFTGQDKNQDGWISHQAGEIEEFTSIFGSLDIDLNNLVEFQYQIGTATFQLDAREDWTVSALYDADNEDNRQYDYVDAQNNRKNGSVSLSLHYQIAPDPPPIEPESVPEPLSGLALAGLAFGRLLHKKKRNKSAVK